MKKITRLFMLVALVSATMSSFASEPSFEWGNIVGGNIKQSSNAATLLVPSQDQLYLLGNIGWNGSGVEATYAGELLFNDASTTEDSQLLTLFSLNGDGTKKWFLHATNGDYESKALALYDDGSLFFATEVRQRDLPAAAGSFVIVDGKGDKTTFGTACEDAHYALAYGKVSADGALTLIKYVDFPVRYIGDNKLTDVIVCNAVATSGTDAFIAGQFKDTMTFTDTNDAEVTITPQGLDQWDGKASFGDCYILKLNSDGKYVSSITNLGEGLTDVKILTMTASAGKIYFQGQGTLVDGDFSATFGGKNLVAGNKSAMFIGCLDAETMQLDWLTPIQGDGDSAKSQWAMQNSNIKVVGENICFVGQCNGKFTDGNNADNSIETAGKLRNGIIIQLEASTGNWINAAVSNPSIGTLLTGYLDVVSNPNDLSKVYVFGYVMNKNYGAFLAPYTLSEMKTSADETWNIVTGGGTPTAINCAYEAETNSVYTVVRGNAAFQPMGADASEAISTWSIYVNKFKLPSDAWNEETTILEHDAIADAVSVRASAGELIIASNVSTTVDVFDVTGRLVARVVVAAGDQVSVALPKGIYIAAGKKVAL